VQCSAVNGGPDALHSGNGDVGSWANVDCNPFCH
jgi:hypothetical protein